MPPLLAPLSKDGPPAESAAAPGTMHVPSPSDALMGCSWVETSGNDVPRWLCSACSGTAADMAEVVRRIDKTLSLPSLDRAKLIIGAIAKAAIRRYESRRKLEGD